MNRVALKFALLALLPVAAMAADPLPPKQAPAPPPPGMDEPGVSTKPDTVMSTKIDKTTIEQTDDVKDANGAVAPQVSVRKRGDDTVEEYRQDGKITMIRITPKNGVAQTFIGNPDGRLVRDVKQGPVDPVYYTVYQWK